jgi:pimeloyl-ACP methyl ester carboxylesterase
MPEGFRNHAVIERDVVMPLQPSPAIRRELLHVDGHTVAADVHLPANDDRPPVVFLHGVLASLDLATELFVDPAAEPWIALSLPGHHPGALPPACAAADLDEELFVRLPEVALQQLVGNRRVIATGWSTGGFAALNLAIRHPARVAAVASLAGFASGRRIAGMMRWLVWLAGRPLGRPAIRLGMRLAAFWPGAYSILLGCLAADGRAAARVPSEMIDRMHRDFARHDADSLVTALAALWSLDITERLGEISVPAWIAGGAADPAVPRDETVRIAHAIPRATLRVYDRAGHLFFSEWPRHREDFAAWRRSL